MATPNSGYTFNNWQENSNVVSTNTNYSFTVSSNRNLVAGFISTGQQATINASAYPTNAGYTTGGGTYSLGDQVLLTALTNPGWTFINWTEFGSQVSNSLNYSFTADRDRSLIANFYQEFTITANVNNVLGGYTTGGGTYGYGQIATVNAFSNAGYSFNKWLENNLLASNNPVISFTVTSDRTLEAVFTSNAGVEEGLKSVITIYPNPTNNFLTIEAEGITNETYSISLMTTIGDLVKKQDAKVSTNQIKIQIDLMELPIGLYFLSVNSSRINHTFKVVKQ